jgi:hypothetical protein
MDSRDQKKQIETRKKKQQRKRGRGEGGRRQGSLPHKPRLRDMESFCDGVAVWEEAPVQ